MKPTTILPIPCGQKILLLKFWVASKIQKKWYSSIKTMLRGLMNKICLLYKVELEVRTPALFGHMDWASMCLQLQLSEEFVGILGNPG